MSTVAFNYNNWNYWSVYEPSNDLYGDSKVTFDGVNKLILVNYGETELDFREDVYSNWKEWLKDPHRNNAGYEPAISVVGGDPLPGNRALGTTFFLINGWRMRTWEGDHELTVDGNVFTEEGDSLFIPTLEGWTITINLNTATVVETIFGETTITNTDREAIAASVWADANATQLLSDIASIPDDVWGEIIDSTKNETAREKLRKIATKTQDLALS